MSQSNAGAEGDLRGSCCRVWSRPAAGLWSSERDRSDRPGGELCFLPGTKQQDRVRALSYWKGARLRFRTSCPRNHLVFRVHIGSGLHQQFDGLAEAVPGHLVQRRVAVLKAKEKKVQPLGTFLNRCDRMYTEYLISAFSI